MVLTFENIGPSSVALCTLTAHGASKGGPMSTMLQNYGRRSRGHAARLPQSIQPPVWLIVLIYALAGARESGHVRYIGGEEE